MDGVPIHLEPDVASTAIMNPLSLGAVGDEQNTAHQHDGENTSGKGALTHASHFVVFQPYFAGDPDLDGRHIRILDFVDRIADGVDGGFNWQNFAVIEFGGDENKGFVGLLFIS